MDRMFAPRGLAVFGGINRPGAFGNLITLSMIRYGYPGSLYPISSKGGELNGCKIYKIGKRHYDTGNRLFSIVLDKRFFGLTIAEQCSIVFGDKKDWPGGMFPTWPIALACYRKLYLFIEREVNFFLKKSMYRYFLTRREVVTCRISKTY